MTRPRTIIARGISMFPLIPDGTVLLFEPTTAVALGDVVLTEHDGRCFAHRVVRLEADRVVTWGDWNRHPDPPVPLSAVGGRLAVMLRKGVPVSLDWPEVRLASVLLARLLPGLRSALTARHRMD
jgi:hypothetical protein